MCVCMCVCVCVSNHLVKGRVVHIENESENDRAHVFAGCLLGKL